MFKKMLILATLLPGLGGCFWGDDRGRGHEGGGRGHEEHGRHEGSHVSRAGTDPVHGDSFGCVYLNGGWVAAE